MRKIIIKTELKSFLDTKRRLSELTTFISADGHKCENVGRNTLSKMVKRIDARKKNHARSGDYLSRALGKAPYQTLADAKGKAGIIPVEKKYLYKKVPLQSKEAITGEINDVVVKEKKLGMIIGIIMRKKRAGTYECIHGLLNKWTSLRESEDKKYNICQKCGLKIPILGR